MSDRKVTISLFGDDRDLATKIRDAKAKLDDLTARAKNVKIGADDKDLEVKVKSAGLQLDKLGKKIADPKIGLDGIEKFDLELDKASLKLDKFEAKSALADIGGGGGQGFTQIGSDIGALSNYAIPALVAGLVAVSGQVITVGVGLGALGAAAYKDIDPIFKASQMTGGLAANLGTLDSGQRKAALSLLGLDNQYDKFSKSLEPEVLDAFNKSLDIGSTIMAKTQPIAAAAGKALDGVLGSVDAEFKSGTWQNFFGFMEKTAGPDVQQLGKLFTSLLNVIPPLAQSMQPLGSALINDLTDVTNFTGGLAKMTLQVENFERGLNSLQGTGKGGGIFGSLNSQGLQQFSGLSNLFKNFPSQINPAIGPVQKLVGWVEHLGASSGKAAAGQNLEAAGARAAAAAAAAEAASMAKLSGSLDKVSNSLLAAQADEVSWKQAQQAATTAINANKKSLDGNSASALAARGAMIQSTQAAISFADQELNVNHNVGKATGIISNQIAYLANHAAHSRTAAAEVAALIAWENRIPGHISSSIKVNSAAAAQAIADIENRLAALNGQTSTVYVNYAVGGTSYVVPHHRRNATGSIGAPAGWSWVGERGPELIDLRGGERILTNNQSMSAARSGFSAPGFAGGTEGFQTPHMPRASAVAKANVYNVNVNVGPGTNMAEAGRFFIEAIKQAERRNGTSWRS